MDKIFLRELKVEAVIGIWEWERRIKQIVSIDLEMATEIAVNAKTQYVAVCNAMETLLVHRKIADDFLPLIQSSLSQIGVELRGCEVSRSICASISAVTEEDWRTEYLDKILSILSNRGLHGVEPKLFGLAQANLQMFCSSHMTHHQIWPGLLLLSMNSTILDILGLQSSPLLPRR